MPEEAPIKIKIVQLGKQVFNYESTPPCTIEEALKSAQVRIDHLRTDIRLNGETAARDTLLANGDIITVLPPIKGGRCHVLLPLPRREGPGMGERQRTERYGLTPRGLLHGF